MKTIVETVEDWYASKRCEQSEVYRNLYVHSYKSDNAKDGKIEMRYESAQVLASITLWNRGFVMVLTLNKITGKDQTLEDRALNPQDDLYLLLDRYCRAIMGQGIDAT